MNEQNDLLTMRHSCEHVLTQAMERLWPQIIKAMGPATDEGFYFDFDLGPSAISGQSKISEADFPKIEAEMTKIFKEDLPIKHEEMSVAEARKLFKDNPYKMEWLTEIEERGEKASVYWTGKDFVDLCAGPHLTSTGKIGAFKLLSVAGAYWRGSEKNKMLTRIYGTCFPTQKELEHCLWQKEEAEKRDHRKISHDLDLFSVDDYVGSGLILWHPKLSVVREEIELYWRKEHRKRGYQYVYTPHIGLDNLWRTSGHLDFFQASMYPPMSMVSKDKEEKGVYYIKPMNCPFHVRIYKSRTRSYRELPIRWCELGTVYRYEESGVLHGMLRVRSFTQDDAHIICREDQFVEEVNRILDFALDINHVFGFDNLRVYLSVRDPKNKEKYVGEERVWQLSEKTLEEILERRKIKYQKDVGGAKFYGPAIDLKVVDALGREWQGTTIQLDMNLPERFEMTYAGTDGGEHMPIMIHRTLLGSMERFVGTLIEQYAGAFPLWLSPVQVAVLPITDKQEKYAQEIAEKLKEAELRVETWNAQEPLGAKIRNATLQKINYLVIIGEKEEKTETVAIRTRKGEDMGQMAIDKFMKMLNTEIGAKKI